MPLYLVDSSIWISASRRRGSYLQLLLEKRLADGEVAACAPVALEVLIGHRDKASYDEAWAEVWEGLVWLPLHDGAARRALEVQRELAGTTAGAHRRRPIDYIVAACAEDAGEDVVLWHWDADLTAICEHTGQLHEPEHERAREHGLD